MTLLTTVNSKVNSKIGKKGYLPIKYLLTVVKGI